MRLLQSLTKNLRSGVLVMVWIGFFFLFYVLVTDTEVLKQVVSDMGNQLTQTKISIPFVFNGNVLRRHVSIEPVGLSLTFRLSFTFDASGSIAGAHQCTTKVGFLPLLVLSERSTVFFTGD